MFHWARSRLRGSRCYRVLAGTKKQRTSFGMSAVDQMGRQQEPCSPSPLEFSDPCCRLPPQRKNARSELENPGTITGDLSHPFPRQTMIGLSFTVANVSPIPRVSSPIEHRRRGPVGIL